MNVSDGEQRLLALSHYTYSVVAGLFLSAPFATLTQDRLQTQLTRINFFTLDACHTRRSSDHRYTGLDGEQKWEAKCVYSPELIEISLILVFESAVPAQILQKRPHEVYVHYVDTDKRLDEWVPEGSCQLQELSEQQGPPTKKRRGRPPRKLTPEPSASTNAEATPVPASETVVEENGVTAAHVILSEEEFDMRQHKQLTAQKNFDTVMFDVWKITPW